MLQVSKKIGLVLGFATVAALVPSANAALTLSTTGASLPLYSGDAPASGSGTTGGLLGDVQYAVFAPGTFPTALLGADPSAPNPGDYVYAYLVNNSAASTLGMNILNVGYATGATLRNISHDEGLGGNVPLAGQGAASNAFYNFFYIDPITPGGSSDILLFSSPQAPTFASATVGNGGVNDQFILPSPSVPEPATGALLLAGSGLATLRRRRSSK